MSTARSYVSPTSGHTSLLALHDADIMSPIINGCPAIEQDKENIDMSVYELRLLEAFCRGREQLDAEMPVVMEEILQTLDAAHADDTSAACHADAADSAAQPCSEDSDSHALGRGRLPIVRQSRSPLPPGFPRAPLQDITGILFPQENCQLMPDPKRKRQQGKGQSEPACFAGLAPSQFVVQADPELAFVAPVQQRSFASRSRPSHLCHSAGTNVRHLR